MPGFDSIETLTARLTSFLDTRGFTVADLAAEADQGVGAPILAVASGSVLAGFGNVTSDIDLHVLVDGPVTGLPITTHRYGSLVDVAFKSLDGARDAVDRLRGSMWPPASCTRADWLARQRDLDQVSRFALGLVVAGEPKWRDWQLSLRDQWLVEAIRDWWTVEAHRLSTAATWLAPVNPRLAALRGRQAVVAALDARMAEAGQPYFRAKWIAEKLTAAGDDLSLLREALRPGVDPGWCVEQVRRLIGDGGNLGWHLEPAGGVSSFGAGDVRVVSRWDMRMATAPAHVAELTGRGPLDEPPPDHLLELFAEDMLWLSIVDR